MARVKRLAWLLGFLFACGLLVVTGSSQLRHLAEARHDVPFFLVLSLLLAIPTSLVTLAAAYLLEWLFVGWSRSSLESLLEAPASVRLDMLSGGIALLPHRWLSYLLSLGLLYLVDAHWLEPRNLSVTQSIPWWVLQVVCLVLFQSFIAYWMHRLEHAVPALWALHQFHHSAERMSILTTDRQTELTKGVEQSLMLFFLVLVGDPTAAQPGIRSPLFVFVAVYFVYRIFMGVNHYLCHSNLTTDYGWFGRWFLVSPRMHRLHHAVAPEYHDRNFTFDLVIWDRLFGTYANCDAATVSTVRLGLTNNPFNSGTSIRCVLRDYLVTPYVVFWKALQKGLEAWLPAWLNNAKTAAGLRPGP